MTDLKINLGYSLFLFMCSCLLGCESMHPKMVAASNFNNSFVKYGMKKYNLEADGMGGGWPGDTISFLSISFVSNKYVDINEARKLILGLTEDMLNAMKNDSQLVPWIKNRTPTYDNVNPGIGFDLLFEAPQEVADKYIALVLSSDGKFSYFKYDVEKEKYNKILVETVEEARQRIKEEEDEKHN